MGMHTGEPAISEGDYVGLDVHLAARIAASGHGGQVVVSGATRALLDDAVPLADLGEHRLKDFEDPVQLFQLGDGRFPPLKTISNTNLPRPASSFVGREREVREVLALLRDGARVLTLTGPGGSGKTRLAIEAATELVPEFKAGVFWTGLAPIRDAALVVGTIAQTVGAKSDLAQHIGEREMLLLLDNFEQVVDAAPELSALLAACPSLRLLVTSRELLRIQGEVEYPVPPLAQPEAVELFCSRSRLEADATISEVCRRLDDLPLAVELAAARTSVLSPAQLLERLSQRLDLLKGGRDSDQRQATLRATIDWSYDLLSTEEKRLFARLAVFAGGCTLQAAEDLAQADLDTLQSLVEKSLVRYTNERFWMLETIREYALERLEESAGADDLGRRHFAFFLRLAQSAGLSLDVEEEQRYDLVIPERDNLRAAIGWAVERDPRHGLVLATALEQFWLAQNPVEGIRTFEALLARAGDLPADLRAYALRDYGGLVSIVGRFEEGTRLHEQSLAEFRRLGDEHGIATLLERLTHWELLNGNLDRTRALAEEARIIFERTGFRRGVGLALTTLGEVAYEEGDHDGGLELIERGASIVRESGFLWYSAMTYLTLAERTWDLGRQNDARQWANEALVLGHAIGDRQVMVYTLAVLARAAALCDDPTHAGRLWGAIEREEQRGPIGQWEGERETYAAAIMAQSSPDFEHARSDGWHLTLDEAVALALAPREEISE